MKLWVLFLFLLLLPTPAEPHSHKFVVRAIRDRSAWELTNGRLGAKHGARAVLVNANVASRLRTLRPNEFDVQEYVTPILVQENENNVVVVRFNREVLPTDLGKIRSAVRGVDVVRIQKLSFDRVGLVLARNVSVENVRPITDLDAVQYVSGVTPFERHALMEYRQIWGTADSYVAFLATNSTVALADTGIDAAHCAFEALGAPTALLKDVALDPNATPNTGMKIRVYVSVCTSMMSDGGSGTCVSSTDYTDAAQGHGTAMASVLAGTECTPADPDAERGGVSGQIVFFDLLSGSGSYLVLPLHLQDMFASALAFGAQTFAASWGAGCRNLYDDTAIQADTFIRANSKALLVFSAGNCGNSLPKGVASPATAKNVLSVGATMSGADVYVDGSRHFASSDVVANAANYARTSVASFTSVGSSVRRIPLVATSGVMVSSAEAGTSAGFFLVSGTSPAAQVAAAIMETIRQNLRGVGVDATAATLRASAIAVAVPLQKTVDVGATKVYVSTDNPASRGYFGTLMPSWANESDWTVRQTSVASFDVVSFCGSSFATIAVAWDDPPGVAGSTRPLLNELFVVVVDAAGNVLAHDLDVDNNHKKVSVTSAAAWRLSVSSDMMSEAQSFSVVVVNSPLGSTALTSCSDACAPLDAPRPLPCAASHATGLRTCVSGSVECWPATCDTGYEFVAGSKTCAAAPASGSSSCSEYLAWNGTTCVCVGDILCSDSTIVQCRNGVFSASPNCVVTRADITQEYEYVSNEPFVVHSTSPSVAPWLAFAVGALEILGLGFVFGTSFVRKRKSKKRLVACLDTNDGPFLVSYILQGLFAVLGVALLETSVEASVVFLAAWLVAVAASVYTVPRTHVIAATFVVALVVLVVGLAESYSPQWGTNFIYVAGAFVIVVTLMTRSIPEAYVVYACLSVVLGVWLVVSGSVLLCNADETGTCTSSAHVGVATAWILSGLVCVVLGVYMFDPCDCTVEDSAGTDGNANKSRCRRCRCLCTPDGADTDNAAFDFANTPTTPHPPDTASGQVKQDPPATTNNDRFGRVDPARASSTAEDTPGLRRR